MKFRRQLLTMRSAELLNLPHSDLVARNCQAVDSRSSLAVTEGVTRLPRLRQDFLEGKEIVLSSPEQTTASRGTS